MTYVQQSGVGYAKKKKKKKQINKKKTRKSKDKKKSVSSLCISWNNTLIENNPRQSLESNREPKGQQETTLPFSQAAWSLEINVEKYPVLCLNKVIVYTNA